MAKQKMFIRHRLSNRLCHWFIAASGLFTMITGLSFLYPSFGWLGNIAGTPTLARIIHPFTGVAMCVVLVILSVRYYHHNRWNKYDLAWMKNVKHVMTDNEEKIPPVGHYNPGQKMLFRTNLLSGLVLGATGFIMWQPYFAPNFSPEVVQWAILIHVIAALLMIQSIVVHVWMALWVEGSIPGMLYGKVSRAWLKKHHPMSVEEYEREQP
ncbi:formate dehydrogenase subunit gamma [Parasalinivibrio latis]|uniref:formate dehydrogenase subunit gamma n=1 Tax=Parasalinivibrio latis TaxID=2952610 RepID=UPI0030E3A527